MQNIAFLLLDGHALMSTASALEPLRAANQFRAGTYRITILSGSDRAVSSIGSEFPALPFRATPPDFDLVFVVAGGDPARVNDPALMAWLREADRRGVALGGISGGAMILARAGLLEGRRFTLHWHHYDDIAALPGEWLLERRLFVIDRNRYTCAGGIAPLDMMHALIAREHGTGFAQRISDWFIQTEIRGADAPQMASIEARYGVLPKVVAATLELMESHIADPLDQSQLAGLAGLSLRQLQRQFRQEMGAPVMEVYRRIRLEKAHELIAGTRLPLSEIAHLTGFASQSHFADRFRETYGHPPRALRDKKSPTSPK
ncbi:GlxA family transcriptional regulator [Thioclava sp. GXIMD4215]|uniref:GlxA family transcriptional regulator n=1 Tax=Thioclava sp. GXIMD4215 TaxID=3131928 RepID=UPI00311AE1EF